MKSLLLVFVAKMQAAQKLQLSRCFSRASSSPTQYSSIYHESTDTQICTDTGRLAAKVLYMKAVIKFVTAEALWVEELRGRFLYCIKA